MLADAPNASAFLRQTSKDTHYGIARAISKQELARYARVSLKDTAGKLALVLDIPFTPGPK